MASLSLKNVCKVYPNGFEAVKDFNLDVADKEFIIFVGPSGCGKSTTLRMIAGLEEISSGDLIIDGKVMNDVEPKDRDIAMVFQNYALYPHMTVYDNIAFGLKLQKVPKDEIKKRVTELLEITGLAGLEKRYPSQLSGGQRQALTLLMATMNPPKLLLLDEHTAALDPKTAAKVLAISDKIIQEHQLTAMMVTHNMKDAINIGNRLIMMSDGKIIYDVKGEEKKKLKVADLLQKFEEASGGEFANDRMLLS